MNRLTTIVALLIISACGSIEKSQGSTSEIIIDTALEPAGAWFSAWELAGKRIYHLDTLKPVNFIFFDEEYLYTTPMDTGRDGEEINGPDFFDHELTWKKKLHHGEILLPGEQKVPIGLMSFAMPVENGNAESVFIMPLPKFWEKEEVKSKELGLGNLLTGVFLHEFSHSQQMENFGAGLSYYESKYSYRTEFSDDIIQDYFQDDSTYVKMFRHEVMVLYRAARSENRKDFLKFTREGLELINKRQSRYFAGDLKHLRRIDDFFLTMEGVGQYSMYAWLTHPEGVNFDRDIALKGTRRDKEHWSQDEGLALMLILSRFLEPSEWAKYMFSDGTTSSLELIKRELEKELENKEE